MGRGTVRGAFTAWLALIALHTVGTRGGSGRITEAFNDITGLIERALDPTVPGVRDRRTATGDSAVPAAGGVARAVAAGAAAARPSVFHDNRFA